jgi:DNA-binding CsgD family transcriptional regulator
MGEMSYRSPKSNSEEDSHAAAGGQMGDHPMVTVDDFSRLVAGIYASAAAPQYWEGAIRDVHRAFGGIGAVLLTADGPVWSYHETTIPAEAAKNYSDHYCRLDHALAAVEEGPVGRVWTGTELVAPHRNSEFYVGWLQPLEYGDGLFVRLSGEPTPSSFLVATPRRTESFDSPERMKLMSALTAHLQQALRTQHQLAASVERSANLTGALDLIRHGVIIAGSECRVISLNSAAKELLRAIDGLHTVSGRIGATNLHAERELHRALHIALLGDRSGVRGGHSFICRRPSGKRPYVIHVMPLHRTDNDERPGEPSALVLIKDPDHEPEPETTLLHWLYGVTMGEAEVAQRLAHGASLKQIADELSVSYQTVRTHLQHAFDKTDSHRQAELVRLLLALSR